MAHFSDLTFHPQLNPVTVELAAWSFSRRSAALSSASVSDSVSSLAIGSPVSTVDSSSSSVPISPLSSRRAALVQQRQRQLDFNERVKEGQERKKQREKEREDQRKQQTTTHKTADGKILPLFKPRINNSKLPEKVNRTMYKH